MPVVPATISYAVTGQVNLVSQPGSQQLNFKQMLGELASWNPDAPAPMLARWLQNSYRRIIDYRNWYGCMVRGQVNSPATYNTGTVAVTNGSATITGTGTTWTSAMVGRQFRTGMTTPIYTIKTFTSPTSMELDIPWGEATATGSGYSIFQNVYDFGYNVKQLLRVVNKRQGFNFILGLPQAWLDENDPWRSAIGFTYAAVGHPPSSAGSAVYEFYPIPNIVQSFPFIAYIQPPDLSEDNPYALSFIRTDVIVLGALPDALLYRGKDNKYYNPQVAAYKDKIFREELAKMSAMDEGHYMRELMWDYDRYPTYVGGPDYAQSHE